ncbi:unnamed protein product [Arctogadus glacialis]
MKPCLLRITHLRKTAKDVPKGRHSRASHVPVQRGDSTWRRSGANFQSHSRHQIHHCTSFAQALALRRLLEMERGRLSRNSTRGGDLHQQLQTSDVFHQEDATASTEDYLCLPL